MLTVQQASSCLLQVPLQMMQELLTCATWPISKIMVTDHLKVLVADPWKKSRLEKCRCYL